MTNTTAAIARGVAAGGIADEIAQLLERIFDSVELIRARTQELFASAGGDAPAAKVLAALADLAAAQVGEGAGLIVGSGFVAAPGAVADQAYFLEWWSTPGDAPASRLEADLDPESDMFHDYTRLPWYVVPRETGRRHITGPYVDYLCTDEYTLTFTSPVYAGGRFVGVAGADVFVGRFESLVLPRLRGLPYTATLINAQGRVCVSNSARQRTGSLVRQPEVAALWVAGHAPGGDGGTALYRCGDFPLAVLVDEGVHRRTA